MKTVVVAGVSSTTSGSPPNNKNTNNIHSIASDNSSNSVTLTSDNNNTESNYFDDKSLDSSTAAGVDIQFQTPTSTQNSTKRPISLDLNTNKNPVKKQRLVTSTAGGGSATTAAQSAVPSTLVLESPDLQGIKMTTPDLEKFLLSGSLLQTPTPGIVFPTKVTSEQEDYAKGFVDALNSLRNSENSHSNGMSGGSFTYTNLETSFPVAIKDEPQGGPASPPVSPIDMETQEKIKLERKRQRNRVAASKCRKRKLERISKLEDKVKLLKGENSDLASVVKNLKEHVFQLKQQVIEHIGSGCNISAQNCGTVLQGK